MTKWEGTPRRPPIRHSSFVGGLCSIISSQSPTTTPPSDRFFPTSPNTCPIPPHQRQYISRTESLSASCRASGGYQPSANQLSALTFYVSPIYRRSAKFGSSYQLPLVILSAISRSPEPAKGKNHSPKHNADWRGPSFRSQYHKARLGPCSLYPALFLTVSLTSYALRTTHYAVERGVPARGGYPLHSPLSYYSTHRSPPRMHNHPHSGGLPTHDPISCPSTYQPLTTNH